MNLTELRNTLPDVVRSFYRQLGPNTRYWGDKNPHYADPNNRGCLALTAERCEYLRLPLQWPMIRTAWVASRLLASKRHQR